MRKLLLCLMLASILPSTYAQNAEQRASTEKMYQQESVRNTALREYALAKGIADGRRARFQELYSHFEINSRLYDQLYHVDHLYMQPKKQKNVNGIIRYEDDPAYNGFLIQPAIILTGTNIMQLANSGKSKERTSARYAIGAEAQFVSAPLYWKTFLISPDDLMQQGPADDPILQPRNEDEKAYMLKLYQIGMSEGNAQASMEVENRVKTLGTMISGMVIGRVLMDKNVLTMPKVTTEYIPVSGNNTLITFDTSAARIVEGSRFNLDASTYKAFVHQPNPLAMQESNNSQSPK